MSRKPKSKRSIAAEKKAAKERFDDAYVPFRHRIPTAAHVKINSLTYAARTIDQFTSLIYAFENSNPPEGAYLCIVGAGRHSLIGYWVSPEGEIYGGNGSCSSAVLAMREQLSRMDQAGDRRAVSHFGSFGDPDITQTRMYEIMYAGQHRPGEKNKKTVLIHTDGDSFATVNTQEEWCLRWLRTKEGKPGWDIHFMGRTATATFPVEWMYLSPRRSALYQGASRLFLPPESHIDPPVKNCTLIEHLGGMSTATVYAGEPWSQEMVRYFRKMYGQSCSGTITSSVGGVKVNVIPASWIKLTAPTTSEAKKVLGRSRKPGDLPEALPLR